MLYRESILHVHNVCTYTYLCIRTHLRKSSNGKAAMGRNGETSCKAEVLVFGKKKIKTE